MWYLLTMFSAMLCVLKPAKSPKKPYCMPWSRAALLASTGRVHFHAVVKLLPKLLCEGYKAAFSLNVPSKDALIDLQ